MSVRKTNYDDVPRQTQSFGRNDIVLPIDLLFAQAYAAMMAESLEKLLQGTNVPGDPNAMVRRCEASPKDIIKILRLATALPSMLPMDLEKLNINAEAISDLQQEDGEWRNAQSSRREQCVDNQVSIMMQRLSTMTRLFSDTLNFFVNCRKSSWRFAPNATSRSGTQKMPTMPPRTPTL
jgi:antitoxin component of RelBE/YafQ-DinJ toxin-antitoxin module